MMTNSYEEDLKTYLDSLPIQTLRVLGRRQGVPSKCLAKKPLIIQAIADIFMGRIEPNQKSNRGAPVKNDYLDPQIMSKLFTIRREHDEDWDKAIEPQILEVASPTLKKTLPNEKIFTGIVEEQPNGTGMLRIQFGRVNKNLDGLIPCAIMQAYQLRNGDYISCHMKNETNHVETLTVERVLTVNEQVVGQYTLGPRFEDLTPDYPKKKIELSKACNELDLRILDLFVPIGMGQRALIVAPPQTGNTTLLKDISCAMIDHHSAEIKLIVLLLDARPEDVTEFRNSVGYYALDLFYSTFDEEAEEHVRIAKLAIDHAKRYAERNRNVLLLCDSVTKLAQAYQTLLTEQDAVLKVKQFLGAARYTLEAGSITILATTNVDECESNTALYEKLRDTCNAEIILSERLARNGIFPAIDFMASKTRREENLLTNEELVVARAIRAKNDDMSGILKRLSKAKTNEAFVTQQIALKQ